MKLTADLREKFLAFREAYLAAEERMIEDEVQQVLIARMTWEEALAAVPLAPDELMLYKKLVAMHSVNGGELFAEDY
jgi:hypothetical protein